MRTFGTNFFSQIMSMKARQRLYLEGEMKPFSQAPGKRSTHVHGGHTVQMK